MSKLRHIYDTACQGTASGRGPSYWSIATSCGLRRKLLDAQGAAIDAGQVSEAARCGTFVHALMDAIAGGLSAADLAEELGDVQDCEWADAVRIVRFFTETFAPDFFGTVLASEQRLPVNDTHAAAVERFFGHREVTGQIDRLVELDAAACSRLEKAFGLTLRGPGLYILDFKTSGARWNEGRAQAAAEGMQAMTYQVLWNLAGGVQIKGMLFLVLVKHKALTVEKSVQLFGSYYQADWPEIVREGINLARARRNEARPDPFACYSLFDVCPFVAKGCSRK